MVWRIVNTPSGETADMDFAAWDAYWGPEHEADCRRGALPWFAGAATKKRLSELSPADLAAQNSGDPISGPGTDLGGDRALLPIPSPLDALAAPGSEPTPGR